MDALVVTLPAVAPVTLPAVRALCAELDRLGVPVSLPVVAGPWAGRPLSADPGAVAWLRERVAGGDEVVLHGWALRAGPLGPAWQRGLGRLAAGRTSEFAAVGEDEAYGLLAAGVGALDRLGLPVSGFAPPGGLASPGTVRALSRTGVRYRLTRRHLHELGTGVRVPLGPVRVAVTGPESLRAVQAAVAAGRVPVTCGALLVARSRPADAPAV